MKSATTAFLFAIAVSLAACNDGNRGVVRITARSQDGFGGNDFDRFTYTTTRGATLVFNSATLRVESSVNDDVRLASVTVAGPGGATSLPAITGPTTAMPKADDLTLAWTGTVDGAAALGDYVWTIEIRDDSDARLTIRVTLRVVATATTLLGTDGGTGELALFAARGDEPATRLPAIDGTVRDFGLAPDRRSLWFLRDRDGDGTGDLYVVDLGARTAGAPVRVDAPDTTAGGVTNARWAADGTTLLFPGGIDTAAVPELFAVERDATNCRRLHRALSSGSGVRDDFAPTGDGTRVVYVVDGDGAATLRTVTLDGADERVLGDGLGHVVEFAPQPAGSAVAFTTVQHATTTLHVGDARTGRSSPVRGTFATTPGNLVGELSWSPNGRALAFVADGDVAGRRDLYIASSATGVARRVRAAGHGHADIERVQWAPDSSRVAYTARVGAGLRLFTVVPDDAAAAVAVSADVGLGAAGVRSFAWAPDAARLAYLGDDLGTGFELFTTHPAELPSTVQSRPTRDIETFAWAPDARRLAFCAEQQPGLREGFAVAPDRDTTPTCFSGDSPSGASGVRAECGLRWAHGGDTIYFVADAFLADTPELLRAGTGPNATITRISAPTVHEPVRSLVVR